MNIEYRKADVVDIKSHGVTASDRMYFLAATENTVLVLLIPAAWNGFRVAYCDTVSIKEFVQPFE